MAKYQKPEPSLDAMPVEIIDLIARHTFQGQIIKLSNSEDLGNLPKLVLTYPIASILSIKGTIGQRATEIMLNSVIFTLPTSPALLHILRFPTPQSRPQIARIRHLGITVFDLARLPTWSLRHFASLKCMTVTFDWCDQMGLPANKIARGWMLGLCWGMQMGRGDIQGAKRVFWEEWREWGCEVEVRLGLWRGEVDLSSELNVIQDGGQEAFREYEWPLERRLAVVVVLGKGGIAKVEAAEGEDEAEWRKLVEREFGLPAGDVNRVGAGRL